MVLPAFDFPETFIADKLDLDIGLSVIRDCDYDDWCDDQDASVLKRVTEQGFNTDAKQALIHYGDAGEVTVIVLRVADDVTVFNAAKALDTLRTQLPKDVQDQASLSLDLATLSDHEAEQVLSGFALSNYSFNTYKALKKSVLKFVIPSQTDMTRVKAFSESAFMLRNLINIPANDMGPDEMEAAISHLAGIYDADLNVIKGAALARDFPLIHTVGMASPRVPRLIELNWGDANAPKLTLVGKGVVFDTGGLDIKPSQYMRLMKKDMGGAAHALALAQMVMALELPVQLRVLIPCVENAVGGASFRPGDIIKSRKGLTVENTNTDAEGRLILADSLTYASEDNPDLIIDFATLTGSARAALGQDIPAMFSNSDKVANDLQPLSFALQDPLWRMPLWADYEGIIESTDADLVNSAGQPGDLIYSALFLQKFLNDAPDWVHIDVFAWESSGRPARSKGGTEMGLRAIFTYLETRYGA